MQTLVTEDIPTRLCRTFEVALQSNGLLEPWFPDDSGNISKAAFGSSRCCCEDAPVTLELGAKPVLQQSALFGCDAGVGAAGSTGRRHRMPQRSRSPPVVHCRLLRTAHRWSPHSGGAADVRLPRAATCSSGLIWSSLLQMSALLAAARSLTWLWSSRAWTMPRQSRVSASSSPLSAFPLGRIGNGANLHYADRAAVCAAAVSSAEECSRASKDAHRL